MKKKVMSHCDGIQGMMNGIFNFEKINIGLTHWVWVMCNGLMARHISRHDCVICLIIMLEKQRNILGLFQRQIMI